MNNTIILKFNDYYNKQEINNKFLNIDLSLYYTKNDLI